MFKYVVLACLLAVAAAKPGSVYTAPAVVSAYSAPGAIVSPYAYSNYAAAPVAYSAYNGAAYSAYNGASPLSYTAVHGAAPLAYSAPVAYTSTYNGGVVKALPYSAYGSYVY